ncbi:MAG: CDP-glycerol glycerophosphotransferase family protein, partial [Patescibacteria group bacterium]|nr:CDP-glycerol glycerophosphotransferase family protein [Patescibacteria group bacterium]
LRLVPGFKRFIQWVDRALNPQTEHDYLFKKYRPELAFVTAVNSYMDSSVTKGARRFGVPTVGMPKSWDNLSKSLFNAPTDYLLVWSEFMRRQAVRYQGYPRNRVIVTGVPQFDIYTLTKHLLSRDEFCRKFNFDPNKKIILHGSCGGGVGINMEADYPEMVQKWIDTGALSDAQVLIRPHIGYKDEAEKFERVAQLPNIVLDRTDKQDPRMPDRWDPSFGHIKHLYNSLYHADVCVNLGSTLTLDAAACGTPVINISFDKDPNVEYRDSVRRLHKTDYILELMKSGGTWVARSKEEFLDALKAVLERGEKKDTSTMVDQFMCKNDGKAGERIVSALLGVMENAEQTLTYRHAV